MDIDESGFNKSSRRARASTTARWTVLALMASGA
jgi:hypothetical protein